MDGDGDDDAYEMISISNIPMILMEKNSVGVYSTKYMNRYSHIDIHTCPECNQWIGSLYS